jgi:hypothetical protein
VKSSACRCNEHTLCDTFGKVRLVTGKVIGCQCDCHAFARKKRLAMLAKARAKLTLDESDEG